MEQRIVTIVDGGPADEQLDRQLRYHRELFPALFDWERTRDRIVEFTGESGPSGLLGLDQMGHLGSHGCDLIVEEIRARTAPGELAIAELGSGFGGALRHLVDRLGTAGRPVRTAYGIELVPEHTAVSRRISRSQQRGTVTELCADARAVPLADGVLDVVVVTGSMPHFPDPGAVLAEAARLVRPGGLLVCTEEVSLVADGATPGGDFRRLHPAGVFFVTAVSTRLDQLRAAGFTDVRTRPLRDWAVELLSARLKALTLFLGSVTGILGRESVDRVRDTLTVARAEFEAGRVVPMLVSARAGR